MMYPLIHRYDIWDFIREDGVGYKTTKCVIAIMETDLISGALEYVCDDFTIGFENGLLIILVERGMWYDGASLAIDTDDRMLFALLHDCCCLASQDTKDFRYERLLDNLAYEIIRKQGHWSNWFRAWRTEVAVRAWDSTNA